MMLRDAARILVLILVVMGVAFWASANAFEQQAERHLAAGARADTARREVQGRLDIAIERNVAMQGSVDSVIANAFEQQAEARESIRAARLETTELLGRAETVAGDSLTTLALIDSLASAHADEVVGLEAAIGAQRDVIGALTANLAIVRGLYDLQVALLEQTEEARRAYQAGAEAAMASLRAKARRDRIITSGLAVAAGLVLARSLLGG